MVEFFLQAVRSVPFRQLIGQVSDHALNVHVTQQSRSFPDGDRTGTECLQHESDLFQVCCLFVQTQRIFFRQFDNFRDQENLARNIFLRQCLLQPFIDEPLVRRVLIDNHNTIRGL